jgi:phage terminase large subunit
LDLRLRAKVPNLQILLSFNPVSKVNWCYKHWFENGAPQNTKIIKTTYKDNRFLPQDYINALEAMKDTNPTYYNIYALGEFCSLDKLVYNNWTIGTVEDTNNLELLLGLDFGYVNDATAFVVAYLDETNKTIYIEQEVY